MGCLRLWLATLVLIAHTNTMPMVGSLAVECFFIISGFYMQMLINEQYREKNGWIPKFYANRFLRIYVPYWTVGGIIIVGSLLFPAHARLPSFSIVTALFNVSIIGTETIRLMCCVDDCDVVFKNKIVILPAWSLGMELLFYIVAPIILRKLCWTVCVAIVALLFKVLFLYQNAHELDLIEWSDGMVNGIWVHEVGLFALGAVAYHIYAKWIFRPEGNKEEQSRNKFYLILLIVTLLGSTALLLYIFALPYEQMLSYYYMVVAVFLCLLPFIFAISRYNRWDRSLGDVSYAFYLSHSYIIGWFKDSSMNKLSVIMASFVITYICAALITYYVEYPLSIFRQRNLH